MAQIAAPRNGRRIHRDVPIRVPMKSTARTVRVMSRWVSATVNSFRQALALIHGTRNRARWRTGASGERNSEVSAGAFEMNGSHPVHRTKQAELFSQD